VLETHEALGITTAISSVVVLILYEKTRRGSLLHDVAQALVLVVGLLVAVTGHFGGTLVFGLHYFKF